MRATYSLFNNRCIFKPTKAPLEVKDLTSYHSLSGHICEKNVFFSEQCSFISKLRTYIQNLSRFATTEICSLRRCPKICFLQIRASSWSPHPYSLCQVTSKYCIFLITQVSCFCTCSAFCLQRHFPSPYLSDKLLLSLKARSCLFNCGSCIEPAS